MMSARTQLGLSAARRALTRREEERLSELEGVIDRGRLTFIEVGNALQEIRHDRLYRSTHETFEAYCRERWGFQGSRGRQMIAAAKVAKTVTRVTLDAPPATEAQARALAPVLREKGPEAAARTLAKVREQHGEKATAAHIRRAARAEIEPPAAPCQRDGPEPRPALASPQEPAREVLADAVRHLAALLALLARHDYALTAIDAGHVEAAREFLDQQRPDSKEPA
jgi:hypothetical protein